MHTISLGGGQEFSSCGVGLFGMQSHVWLVQCRTAKFSFDKNNLVICIWKQQSNGISLFLASALKEAGPGLTPSIFVSFRRDSGWLGQDMHFNQFVIQGPQSKAKEKRHCSIIWLDTWPVGVGLKSIGLRFKHGIFLSLVQSPPFLESNLIQMGIQLIFHILFEHIAVPGQRIVSQCTAQWFQKKD